MCKKNAFFSNKKILHREILDNQQNQNFLKKFCKNICTNKKLVIYL